MSIYAKVDSSRLRAAIKWRMEAVRSKRTLRQVVCTAAHEVAIGAMERTPHVWPGKIDAELNVAIAPRFGKRGKLLGYNRRKRNYASLAGTATLHPSVPLAALIIQARTNYQSVYNARTNRRYYMPNSPFKGVSRAAGRAAMRDAVNKMIKARHSSPHFLASGWKPVIAGLAPESANRFRASMSTGAHDFKPGKQVVTIVDNGSAVYVRIENAVGLQGANAKNFNNALWQYGAPALQRAIDVEEIKMLAYIRDKIAADDLKANAMMR